jgi:hypothetical protein
MNERLTSVMLAAMVGSVAVAAGCKERPPRQLEPDTRMYGQRFLEPGEMGHNERIDLAQQRAGARADASLHEFHFDRSGGLNTLGEEKLGLMLAPDESIATTQPASSSAVPFVVYVDTPEDDGTWSAKKDAVARFASAHGWTDGQIEVRHGTNREVATPTASLLSDKDRAAKDAAQAAKEDLTMKTK